MDVVVTDHHAPRADGALPDAPIVHPRLGGYPCPDLCAAGVALQARAGAAGRRGRDPGGARRGPRPRRARHGRRRRAAARREPPARARRACARWPAPRKPGLRALMDVARVDPSGVDERAIGFRLGAAAQRRRAPLPRRRRPRAAADRRPRARARRSPRSSTRSTPSAATSRPGSASRPRRCVAEQARPARPRYVLAAEGWHPGVIGIVAVAHRRAPPPPDRPDRARRRRGHRLRPLDPGLRPARRPARRRRRTCSRYGGHRAAAGLTIAPRPRRRVPRGVRRPRRRGAHARGPRAAASGSTPSPPATRSASSSPRSSSASRRSAWATPPSRCSSPPPCSTTRARWGRAATSRSPSPPAAPAPAASPFGAGSSPAVRAGRTGRRRGPARGQPLERRHRAPADPAQRAPLRAEPIDVIGEPLEHRL